MLYNNADMCMNKNQNFNSEFIFSLSFLWFCRPCTFFYARDYRDQPFAVACGLMLSEENPFINDLFSARFHEPHQTENVFLFLYLERWLFCFIANHQLVRHPTMRSEAGWSYYFRFNRIAACCCCCPCERFLSSDEIWSQNQRPTGRQVCAILHRIPNGKSMIARTLLNANETDPFSRVSTTKHSGVWYDVPCIRTILEMGEMWKLCLSRIIFIELINFQAMHDVRAHIPQH